MFCKDGNPLPDLPADQAEKTKKLRAIIEKCEGLVEGALTSPDVVVLSPSSYDKGSQCMEAYRISRIVPTDSTLAMETGTAFHAGAAEFHRSLIHA